MKTLSRLALILIFFQLTTVFTVSADDEYTKEYKDEFPVEANTMVNISNKFGKVNIMNWDKNTVEIKVIITVEANSREKAEKFFDDVNITLTKENNIIKGITDFETRFNNSDFSIDYEVHMPRDVKLDLTNKFGAVFINELSEKCNITVKYGALKINKLLDSDQKPYSRIILAYSEGSHIGECNWLKLILSYSELEIDKSRALMVKSKYSKLFAEENSSIVAESKYDGYEIGRAKNFVCTGAYAGYEIGQINGKLKLEVKYTDIDVDDFASNFDEVIIEAKYSDIDLEFPSDASYHLNVNTEYTNVEYPESDNISRHRDGTELHLKGTVGPNKNPKSKVSVESKYGEIDID